MKNRKRILSQSVLLILVFLCSMGLFTLSYRYDNKYQIHAPQPINGIFFYPEGTDRPIHLINGWQYYKDKLLTPEDFNSADNPPVMSDGYLAIGQYPGMEIGDPSASPHGSITYRLILCLPDTPASYTLELPEIYSAYRLYIDSRLAASQGNPDPDTYRPALRSGSVTFTASSDVSVLLAVSDWSHLYSGLVYPPAFGESEAVQSLLDQKFAWGLAVTVLALILGFFQLAVSVLLKNRRSLLSGLLCMAFAVSVSSPVIHRLFTTGIVPLYNLEIFCRYAMYGLAALLVLELCGKKNRIQGVISTLAAAFPFAAMAVSFAAPWLTRSQMVLFSHVAGLYKLLTAAWLIGTVFYAGLQSEQDGLDTWDRLGAWNGLNAQDGLNGDTAVLFAGICIFASSLAADRLYSDFEPMRFGWFSEIAGFLFVMLLSFLMLRESAMIYRNQFLLTQQTRNLETQIVMQKKHYTELADQMEAIRTMRHDIRHHLGQLSVLLSDKDLDGAKKYLDTLTQGVSAVPLSFCEAYYVDVLLRYYYAKAQELDTPITIDVRLPSDPGIPEDDLCVILGNLLENGLEACALAEPAHRFLSAVIFKKDRTLAIKISNSYSGELVPSSNGTFVSSKKDTGSQHGIGLSSVRQTAEKYSGEMWFDTTARDNGTGIFTANVFLIEEKN